MNPLEKNLRSSKLHPLTFIGGITLAVAVFISMGLTQLKIEYTPPEPPEPLQEFHLPPPPPPPPAKTPPKKTNVSINFNLPATTGPADVPLGFLDIDFGLSPKKLTQTTVSVEDTLDDFETEGVDDLTVYDYEDVTEKPDLIYKPGLSIPKKLIGGTKKPIELIYLVTVDPRGRPISVHFLYCDYPAAIPTLTDWVMQHRYKPAKKDNKKVTTVIRVKFTYRAGDDNPFSV